MSTLQSCLPVRKRPLVIGVKGSGCVKSISTWVPRDSDVITFNGASVSVSTKTTKNIQWCIQRFQEYSFGFVMDRVVYVACVFNPLNTKRRLLCLKNQFVLRSKHFFFYKYQTIYAVSGTSRCLFSDKYKTNTVWAERTNC